MNLTMISKSLLIALPMLALGACSSTADMDSESAESATEQAVETTVDNGIQTGTIEGIELMLENRNVKVGKNYKNLVDGPGKVCMAFKITKEDFNGIDSCANHSRLYFTQGKKIDQKKIVKNKRIGIEYAQEDKDLLLRYTLINEKN